MNNFIQLHEKFIADIKKNNPKLGAMLEKQHIATMNRFNKAKAKAIKTESSKVETNANKTKQDTQD